MPYDTPHRHHHVQRQVKRRVLVLSRNAVNIWQQCRTRAIETIQKGQRFSLISRSDYQATVTSQVVRNLHRRSVPSEQIIGFHLVCGECDGFVVRNGVMRNCAHQRESWSSVSNNSWKIGREAARRPSSQVTNDVRISIQPPTPESSPEPDIWGNLHRSVGSHSRDAVVVKERRPARPEMREPIPAILRPGYISDDRDDRTIERTEEAVRLAALVPPKRLRRTSVTVNEDADLFLSAGNTAKETRLHLQRKPRADSGSDYRESTDQQLCDTEALMQDWRDWSARWERSVTRPNTRRTNAALHNDSDLSRSAGNAARTTHVHRQRIPRTGQGVDNSGSTDQPHCNSEALMREWREWSEIWEMSLCRR